MRNDEKADGENHRLVARSFGKPDRVLTWERCPRPAISPHSVLVRMRASPINPSDLIPVTGAYAHRTRLPFVPGFEGVGIIEEVDDQIDRNLIGQRVLALGSAGCWQRWKALPADWCVTVPDDIDDNQAASAYINPLTALLMVRALSPAPGDVVGITAAASAIGQMLIRMLAAAGARPVAIVRSQTACDVLRDEPADIVMDGAPLPKLSAGLDAVGGASAAQLAAAIAPGGPLLHYGLLSGQPLTNGGNARLTLFRLRDVVHTIPRDAFHQLMEQAFAEIRVGRAASMVAASYTLGEYREALEHNAQSGRRGKIILRP